MQQHFLFDLVSTTANMKLIVVTLAVLVWCAWFCYSNHCSIMNSLLDLLACLRCTSVEHSHGYLTKRQADVQTQVDYDWFD